MSEINNESNIRSVAVTGGSGFLGINLIRHLLDSGYSVSSLDRVPFDYPEADQVRTVLGDVRDKEKVAETITGMDAVVHCAAALPLHSAEEIVSVGIDGTKTVASIAANQGVKRFVHVSSTAVYGVPKVHPLKETHELVGVGPYGRTKIQAEEVAGNFRDSFPVTIFRPKSFIGPERLGVFALLYDWAATGHNFPIPGKGDNLYQYLDVADFAEAIRLSLVAKPEAADDVYNLGAEVFGTFREDFQSVLDHAGFGKRVVSIPAAPAIWLLRGLDKLNLSPLYPWVYETAVTDSFVAIDKAKNQLGFAPQFSNKQALIRNFEWYLENQRSFAGQSGVSHRVPWKQGALRFARALF